MSDPDAIRADIERTRAELSGDVDALADKVTPSKVVHRQTDKVKNAFTAAKESVMGSVHDAASGISDGASSVGGAGKGAVAKAKGNPLAVGLMAFGAGLLAAALLPSTNPETRAAAQVKDRAQPLVEKAGEAAKEVADHLKDPAQSAAQSVKEAATEAARNVKEDATSAASDVKDSATSATEDVRSH